MGQLIEFRMHREDCAHLHRNICAVQGEATGDGGNLFKTPLRRHAFKPRRDIDSRLPTTPPRLFADTHNRLFQHDLAVVAELIIEYTDARASDEAEARRREACMRATTQKEKRRKATLTGRRNAHQKSQNPSVRHLDHLNVHSAQQQPCIATIRPEALQHPSAAPATQTRERVARSTPCS